jgi:hypothetical protein
MFSIRFKDDNNKEPQQRSRWLVLVGSMILLWVSWWFCRSGSLGLFVLTAICSIIAIFMSKTFRKNTRWGIWSWLFITLLCIIVSVDRLVLSSNGVSSGSYLTNRFIIIFYAYSLCSIFYCSGRIRISSIVAGCIPMAMAVLWESGDNQLSEVMKMVFVWVFIILFIVLDDLGQATHRIKGMRSSFHWKENSIRWIKYIVIIACAIVMTRGVEFSAYKFQDFVLGFDINTLNSRGTQSEFMYLGARLPSDFDKRERLILLINADRTPGYLRENVYVKYSKGQWYKATATTNKIDYLNQISVSETDELVYALTQDKALDTMNSWQIDVVSPGYVSAICLPGTALSIYGDDSSFTIDPNGAVYPEDPNLMLSRYNISVANRGDVVGVQQIPKTFDRQVYLEIPTNMTDTVAEWVDNCLGLEASTSVDQSIHYLQNYFSKNFKYNMRVRLKRHKPLIDFMKKKQGYCIHFASASALMLRSCGIPARVVGGYVCYEWNPWIKRFVVREREGHAWVEAWDKDKQSWTTVETTPADGIPDSRSTPGIFRLAIDWFVFWWKRILYTIGELSVLEVIADSLTVAFLLVWRLIVNPIGEIITIFALASLMFWRIHKKTKQQSEDDVLCEKLTLTMNNITHKMVDERLRRQESESWDLWFLRIKDSLSLEQYSELAELLESYQSIRYQKKLDCFKANEWLEKH